MKRLVFLLFLVIAGIIALAQDDEAMFKVKRFELIQNDTEASVARKLDERDKKCALLKIRTPELNAEERAKFSFQGDAGTETFLEKGNGELKLFLTEGARRLRIMHDDYGVIEYTIPIQIVGFKTYKMVLEVMKPNTPKPMSITSNWVVINVTPKDAIVNIDGNYCPNGKAMVAVGEPHELEVTHPLYHPYEKDVYSDANKKMTYDVKLEPAYGWLEVDSKPESGATVLVNGVRKGVTPFLSDTLVSGEYEVTLLKDMYKNVTKTMVVRDNNVAKAEIKMTPNYAEVSITTEQEADIFVDDNKVGTGSWNGRLTEGGHIIEARKASHRNNAMSVEITCGKAETFNIPAPTPICGALNINSEPDEADVYLDGEKIGETPMIKNNVLVGNHSLIFLKKGYTETQESVTVDEGKMATVNAQLKKEQPARPQPVQKPTPRITNGSFIYSELLPNKITTGNGNVLTQDAFNYNKSAQQYIDQADAYKAQENTIKAAKSMDAAKTMIKKAKDDIDNAVCSESTHNKAKTWHYYAVIYYKIGAYPEFYSLDEMAFEKSLAAFYKIKEIDNEYYSRNSSELNAYLNSINAIFYNNGANKYNDGDYESACIDFKTAYYASLLRNNPDDQALDNAIACLSKTNNLNDNIDIIEAYVNSGKANVNYIFILGTLFGNSSSSNYDLEKALECYDKVIQNNGNYVGDAYYNAAAALIDAAAMIYKEANEANPSNFKNFNEYLQATDAIYDKARAYYKRALPYLEKASKLYPNDQAVQQALQGVRNRLKIK